MKEGDRQGEEGRAYVGYMIAEERRISRVQQCSMIPKDLRATVLARLFRKFGKRLPLALGAIANKGN